MKELDLIYTDFVNVEYKMICFEGVLNDLKDYYNQEELNEQEATIVVVLNQIERLHSELKKGIEKLDNLMLQKAQ